MSARSFGPNRDRGIALLGDPDEGHRPVEPADDPLGQAASFVEDVSECDSPLPQRRGDLPVPFLPPFFLVVAEREIDVARRLEAVRQETLDGLEESDCADLHVQCAAPPEEAVGDLPRERRVRPLRLRPGFDRHDIDVGHQEDRLPRGVGAFPAVEQALASVDLALETRVYEGERSLQVCSQLQERLRVGLRGRLGRDGPVPDGPGQPFGISVERLDRRDGWRVDLLRWEASGVHGHHHEQGEHRDGEDCSRDDEDCAADA